MEEIAHDSVDLTASRIVLNPLIGGRSRPDVGVLRAPAQQYFKPEREGSSRIGMSPQERRKAARADLHWPVRIFRRDRETPLETKTQNISSGGLYSLVEECIPIGEIVDCLLFIPGAHANGISAGLWLRCTARVIHVTALKHALFGIGMCILEYSVIPKLEQALTAQAG